uniref:Uncharacterized protein n=1 Tax=Branchiostoma floridae TaxID=7739 RepID=C3XRV0_BRAFL|eukprot:XP_002613409.1 hypothetical protein BRAFLDRAFT_93773 [Branchiostoma floridae]
MITIVRGSLCMADDTFQPRVTPEAGHAVCVITGLLPCRLIQTALREPRPLRDNTRLDVIALTSSPACLPSKGEPGALTQLPHYSIHHVGVGDQSSALADSPALGVVYPSTVLSLFSGPEETKMSPVRTIESHQLAVQRC